jgi:hypothetical protein
MMTWLPRAGQGAALLAACAASAVVAGAVPAAADSVDGMVNPANNIHATTSQLTFSGLGAANAKTFVVVKHGYTRTLNASSRSCGQGGRAIARFTPDAHAGPAATFTVTPLNPGYCTITVADDGSGAVRVQVDVEPAAVAPSPVPSAR